MTNIYSAFIYLINIQVIKIISGLNMRELEVQQLFSFSHRFSLLVSAFSSPLSSSSSPCVRVDLALIC